MAGGVALCKGARGAWRVEREEMEREESDMWGPLTELVLPSNPYSNSLNQTCDGLTPSPKSDLQPNNEWVASVLKMRVGANPIH